MVVSVAPYPFGLEGPLKLDVGSRRGEEGGELMASSHMTNTLPRPFFTPPPLPLPRSPALILVPSSSSSSSARFEIEV